MNDDADRLLDPRRSRRDRHRRGGGRHGEDDRARRAHPERAGGGRARIDQIVAVTFTEKAAGELKLRHQAGARNGAPAGGRSRGPGEPDGRDPAPRGGARQHDPRLLRRPAARASGRSRGRSAVRRADRAARRAPVRRRVPQLAARAARGSARGRAAGAQAQRVVARRTRQGRRTDRSAAARRARAGRVARLRRRVAARPVRSRRGARPRRLRASASSPRCPRRPRPARDPLFLDTRPVRELAHEIETVMRLGVARLRRLGSARDRPRAEPEPEARPARPRAGVRPRRGARRRVGRVRVADERARRVSARGRRRSRRAAARGARRRARRDTRSSSAAPARSISSICCCARATCSSAMPQVRRAFQSRFTHLFVDEFQDTDPLQAEILLLLAADDPAERDWRRVDARAGKAVSRRRSEAGDLPLPPRRRRDVSGGLRPARVARRKARVPAHQLPRDAGDPARRERRVRAGDGRQSRDAAGAVRRAVHAPARIGRRSRRSSSCRSPSRTVSAASPATPSRSRCRRPSAPSCTGS